MPCVVKPRRASNHGPSYFVLKWSLPMVTAGKKPRPKSAGKSPLENADPQAVHDEAAVLRDLLAATLPPFVRSRKELTLEPDAPPLVAAFWQAMGWSELFESSLAHPDRERGSALARKTLSEFVEQGDTELRVADLPRALRLVHVDTQGVGFMFTDETDSPPDPPVFGIAADGSSRIELVSSSYVRHVARVLSGFVFDRWYGLEFELASKERLPGEPALRLLDRDFRRINDDLWVPVRSDRQKKSGRFTITFRTSAALLAWLAEHPHFPVGSLATTLPEAKLTTSQEHELLREIGAKAVVSAAGWHAVGTLLGEPVLARSSENELSLFVGRRERHALLARAVGEPRPSDFARELIEKLRRPAPRDVERAPALTLTLDEHREQAQEFSSWVDEIAPEHRTEKEPLDLEPDAPGAVAALWNALGASKTIKRRQFWPPTRAASYAGATSALERWFEDSVTRDEWNVPPEASCAPESWLAHPLRMVEAYVPRLHYDYLVPNASHLDFADESSGAIDPPVIRVRPRTPRPSILSRSYVRYVSSLIADELADRRSAPAASNSLAAKGTRICAGWFDGLYRLEPGVWFWCERIGRIVSETDDEDAHRVPLVLFRDSRAYLEFCERMSDEDFAEVGPPYGKGAFTLKKAERFDPAHFDAPGFRLVERKVNQRSRNPRSGNSEGWAISGRISGAPVYLAVRKSGNSTDYYLHCADSDAERVCAWLGRENIAFSKPKR
jgi:hypothetical protein